MDKTDEVRQVLLDLLGGYQAVFFAYYPDLLKLHIDAAVDRLDAIYEVTTAAKNSPDTTTEAEKNANNPS
jgi:hypothetical protein